VLLDEIGRGTATYDGVSIAWAVTEHVHEHIGCKTVFATHYHELTQLADELPAVRNYNVAVREVGDQILFIHRLQPGGADRSYGIEVGRLAGLPRSVIDRAREMLTLLEEEQLVRGSAARTSDSANRVGPRSAGGGSRDQLGLFAQPNPIVDQLAALDVNSITPLDALSRLAAFVDEAKRSR
jgi:DNA mismatch repair protein MutS